MIHHVSVGTNDVRRARAFYDVVLAVLGLRLLKHSDESADYGVASVLFSIESPVDGNRLRWPSGWPSSEDKNRLTGIEFNFVVLNSLLGLPKIPMSGLSATGTAEDLRGS